MGRESSLMVTARDNYTNTISKMAAVTRHFETETDGLTKKLSQLNKNKVTLQVDMAKAKRELSDAKKRFFETGDAIDELNMAAKQDDLNQVTSNLKMVSDQARQTEKDMQNLTDEFSRQQNRASGSSGRAAASAGSMISQLGKAGMTQMLGQSLSGAADAYVGSAFGDAAGSAISSVIGGAASGAAMGTMIGGPGIGTAIGAVGGAVVGMIDGAVETFTKKDDNFKSVVQERYSEAQESQASALSSGSNIASGRETALTSWTTMLGDEGKAKAFAGDIKEMANHTPFLYEDLNKMSKTMKTYGYEAENILPTLTNIGDAGAALGISTGDIDVMAQAIGRMKFNDKTSLEYLNQLTDRGIPAVRYLAEAMGVTNKEVLEMVSKGLIPGSKAAQIITDSMGAEFGGAMELQSKTYAGLASTLQGAEDDLNNAIGEGHNEIRKGGMEDQIDFLNGQTGTKMKEAYGMIGEWKASLENLKDQYERDAITAVMEGALGSMADSEQADRLMEMADEYNGLLAEKAAGNEKAGYEAGRLLVEAQVIAKNEYMASEGYQLELESQLTLIGKIREDASLDDAYHDTGYKLGQAFSKGRMDATKNRDWAEPTGGGPGGYRSSYLKDAQPNVKSNAWGLNRVPYDGYLTELHADETVRTARESRNDAAKGAFGSLIHIDKMEVREEADIYKIAQRMVQELELAQAVAT